MDIMWLIGFFLGIEFLCGRSLAHISVLPIPEDFVGHGTQYRFQYFVRDERGDYKTQEEAGEGGNARGSYAVEEADGDLRIVQYTADLGGGFKAHIKVDHAGGKTPSKLEEIDIPADEMRKLIEKNRRKSVPEVEPKSEASSKSYALGPPKKMSDIVMEQAAAIREIISKEIEAEEKREAEERLKKAELGAKELLKPTETNRTEDVVDCEVTKTTEEPEEVPEKSKNDEEEKCGTQGCSPREGKGTGESPEEEDAGSIDAFRNSQILNKEGNSGSPKTAHLEDAQSKVVRVALNPKSLENGKSFPEKAEKDPEKRDAGGSAGPVLEGPVRNFSFKNRIVFYKPAEGKPQRRLVETNLSQGNSPVTPESGVVRFVSLENEGNVGDAPQVPEEVDQEQIVLYSPYQKDSQRDRKNRYFKVPYEVLRPYLTSGQEQDEKSKS